MPAPLSQGRYPLQSVLGEGGMAKVYRGFDTMLQVERAIKVLNIAMANNEKIRTRFLSEARTMARLRHPNIVAVFDVGMEGSSPYIVMEMIPGGNLMELVRDHGTLPPAVAAWLTIGMLRGLLAGRIAYHLDLAGPAMAVDTCAGPPTCAVRRPAGWTDGQSSREQMK